MPSWGFHPLKFYYTGIEHNGRPNISLQSNITTPGVYRNIITSLSFLFIFIAVSLYS